MLLDPALLPQTAGALPPRSTGEVSDDLDRAAEVLDRSGRMIPDDEHWRRLDRVLPGGPAARALRRRVAAVRVTAPKKARVWSFRELFGAVSSEWVELLARGAAAYISAGWDVAVLVRDVVGRNVLVHGEPPGAIRERTTWNLRVRVGGRPLARLPCLSTTRNLLVPWTCRLDERLPAAVDGAALPYCPRPNWWMPSVPAVSVLHGRPTARDAANRGWTRSPGSVALDHWDVQIPLADQKRVGAAYLNVTNGWPPRQRPPGTIHHGHHPPFSGWSCPDG